MLDFSYKTYLVEVKPNQLTTQRETETRSTVMNNARAVAILERVGSSKTGPFVFMPLPGENWVECLKLCETFIPIDEVHREELKKLKTNVKELPTLPATKKPITADLSIALENNKTMFEAVVESVTAFVRK